MTLNPGSPIRLLPATFHRIPPAPGSSRVFNRLKHLRGKVGVVRRVIGREAATPGSVPCTRALVEVEVGGVRGVVWDFEVREVKA